MFKRRLIRHLAFAAFAALCLASVVDLIVGHEGGFSFLHWIFGHATNGPSAWAGLRDGLLGNLLFFLCAGIVVSVSTWSDPQRLSFVHRLMAMFPHLENHLEWIGPIVSLVKEDASITIKAETTICFEDYDADTGAYKISVIKTERIASLLNDEPYEDADFQIRISADPVAGKEILGSITEAKVTPLISTTKRKNVQPKATEPNDFLPSSGVDLRPGKLTWSVEDKTVQLPAGMDGLITLKYWVYAAITVPFISVIRRPAREVTVKLTSNLKSSSIPVRLHIQGEAERSKVFVRDIKPRKAGMQVISFSPRRRRPVLRLDFGAPGTTLKPSVPQSKD